MDGCVKRNQLLLAWDEAVFNFSKAVSLLKTSQGNEKRLGEQYHATELARLHAKNTRRAMELHRTKHGC
jgi:hypothetical protein